MHALHDPSRPRREQHQTFEEALYQNLRAAPWWAASAALHVAVGLLCAALAGAPPEKALGVERIQAGMVTPPEPPPEEPPPENPPPPPPDAPPEVDESIIPLPNQHGVDTPEYSDTEAEGDPSDDPTAGRFDGPGMNDSIGVGSNAGGGGDPFGGGRKRRTRGTGVPAPFEDNVDRGLRWLAAHQSPDGRWDCDGYHARCQGSRCEGAGGPLHDVGVSGLSLLAFLGHGETHRSVKHGATVRAGLRYLKGTQDPEGCFGGRTGNHWIYDHCIGALAMAEAYGMTNSPLFKTSAQNGIDLVHRAQNPYMAWRYGLRPQDNDTSVTGWAVMALKSAQMSGLAVDPAAFDGVRTWLDKVTEPDYGRAGYTARGNGPARPQELLDRFPADKSESMTAVAVLSRIFSGANEGDPMVRKGADLCAKSPPLWDVAAGTIDYYYWYYGTLAMFQVGGQDWERWRAQLKPAVADTQYAKVGECREGSWDGADPWAAEGGRVYATAINTLTLEVYYRYDRVFGARRDR
jgi:hypothetical protein